MVRGNLNCESHSSTIQGRKVGVHNMHKKVKFSKKNCSLFSLIWGEIMHRYDIHAIFMTLGRVKTLWWGEYCHIVKM